MKALASVGLAEAVLAVHFSVCNSFDALESALILQMSAFAGGGGRSSGGGGGGSGGGGGGEGGDRGLAHQLASTAKITEGDFGELPPFAA